MSKVSETLRIADIATGGAWLPLLVDADLPARYAAATGQATQRPAVGWSIVVGRLALTRGGRPLPPGGVLLGITLTSYRPPPVDGRWEFSATTAVTPHRSGRPIVTAEIVLRRPGGPMVACVSFVLLWPGAE